MLLLWNRNKIFSRLPTTFMLHIYFRFLAANFLKLMTTPVLWQRWFPPCKSSVSRHFANFSPRDQPLHWAPLSTIGWPLRPKSPECLWSITPQWAAPYPLCHTNSEPSGHEDSPDTIWHLMYTIPIKKIEQIAMKRPFFWAILGDFCAQITQWNQQISKFECFGQFLIIISHCMS